MYYYLDSELMQQYEPWRHRGQGLKYFLPTDYVLCPRLGPALRPVYKDIKTYPLLKRQPYCSVCGYMICVGQNHINDINAGKLSVCNVCFEGGNYINENKYHRTNDH